MFMGVMCIVFVMSKNSFAEIKSRPPTRPPSKGKAVSFDVPPVSNKPPTTSQVKEIRKPLDVETIDRPPVRGEKTAISQGAVIGKTGYPELSLKKITPDPKYKELNGLESPPAREKHLSGKTFSLKKIRPQSVESK
jgi:hypothetical protein